MERHFKNPYADYVDEIQTPIGVNKERIKNLILMYVQTIVDKSDSAKNYSSDVYNGNAGISFMFYKMSRSEQVVRLFPAARLARTFINKALANTEPRKIKDQQRMGFYVGNAGIHAIAAAIFHDNKKKKACESSLAHFRSGIRIAKSFKVTPDELLEGRAGYIAGVYWLRDVMGENVVDDAVITYICASLIQNGRYYSQKWQSPAPLAYKFKKKYYFGAAYGLTSVLLMLLKSPYFSDKAKTKPSILADIKEAALFFTNFQDEEGNFPNQLSDLKKKEKNPFVDWSHGAAGVCFMLAKAYLIFKDAKFLQACCKASDLIWQKGLLKSGPGLCCGIAGNGYVFLMMYRLTKEDKYLYRATKFMEFLTHEQFKPVTYKSDYPYSLFQGVAGTVCFLLDLLEPEKAQFPFMDIF